jgi:hypothetical protein
MPVRVSTHLGLESFQVAVVYLARGATIDVTMKGGSICSLGRYPGSDSLNESLSHCDGEDSEYDKDGQSSE